MALKAFNASYIVGAAHRERAVVFDCNEDCFVSVYANSAGTAGATLNIALFSRIAPAPGQPSPNIIASVVDLTATANQLAAALAFPAGCVLEARSFGIAEIELAISAITGPDAAPSATTVR